jgi:hypothetical protein
MTNKHRLEIEKANRSDHSVKPINEPVYWPKTLLAAEYKNCRVLTYGYDSHPSKFFKGPAGQAGIPGHGRSLLNALEGERTDDPDRPLMFIVHSLGGIVLKEVRVILSTMVETRPIS